MLADTVYALLAERADVRDNALLTGVLARPGEVDTTALKGVWRRDKLDAWLASPIGEEAAAEAALLHYLGATA